MAESEFTIVYDGPAIAQGRIPIRDLAPSLLALGELFSEANSIVNPPGAQVAVDVRALGGGSFDVHIVLTTLGNWAEFFGGDEVDALANFQSIVIGGGGITGGIFWFIKRTRRRKILNEEPLNTDTVRLTLDDGTVFEAPAKTLGLFKRLSIRRSVRNVLTPLDNEGVERVEFRTETETTVTVERDEIEIFEPSEGPDELITDLRTPGMALTIENLPLTHPDASWRFSDGDRTFTAAMEDTDFAERVANREERFVSGDLLLATVRQRQYRQPSGRLRNEWSILDVQRHESPVAERVEQPPLIPPTTRPEAPTRELPSAPPPDPDTTDDQP